MLYLTVFLSVAVLTALVCDSIGFCRGDKTAWRKTALLSEACLAAVLLSEILYPEHISFQGLAFDVSMSSIVLLSYPSDDGRARSFAYPVAAAVIALLSAWLRILSAVGVFFIQILLMIVYIAVFTVKTVSDAISDGHTGGSGASAQSVLFMRPMLLGSVLWVAVLSALSPGLCAAVGAVLLFLSAAQHAVFRVGVLSGRPAYPFRIPGGGFADERQVRSSGAVPKDDPMGRELYERACRYMEDNRPYLVPSFRLDDLAMALYTNKLYLSRAINNFSEKNFRQFVNYYRITYSMKLYEDNKRLKVVDMAELSGFNSVVSYNMAFKLVMNLTPSEWRSQCRHGPAASQSSSADGT